MSGEAGLQGFNTIGVSKHVDLGEPPRSGLGVSRFKKQDVLTGGPRIEE
ncbi:MAG: hypothetical protein ACPLSM_02800 [Thermosphaera sp.]